MATVLDDEDLKHFHHHRMLYRIELAGHFIIREQALYLQMAETKSPLSNYISIVFAETKSERYRAVKKR